MGKQTKLRKEAFLRQHPLCCFCGGKTPATTEDHMPPRALFDGRHWPEGYVFPACQSCNDITRLEEQFIAVLARAYPDPQTESQQQEVQKLFQGVANNTPALLVEMQPSAEQLERTSTIAGREEDMGALNVSGPLVNACVRRFALKLVCALHYIHSGKIIPDTGGVFARWYTNANKMDGTLPTEIFQITQERPVIKRQRTNLGQQFEYEYAIGEDGRIGAYFITFRFSFAIQAFVHLEASRMHDVIPATEILHPFSHAAQAENTAVEVA